MCTDRSAMSVCLPDDRRYNRTSPESRTWTKDCNHHGLIIDVGELVKDGYNDVVDGKNSPCPAKSASARVPS